MAESSAEGHGHAAQRRLALVFAEPDVSGMISDRLPTLKAKLALAEVNRMTFAAALPRLRREYVKVLTYGGNTGEILIPDDHEELLRRLRRACSDDEYSCFSRRMFRSAFRIPVHQLNGDLVERDDRPECTAAVVEMLMALYGVRREAELVSAMEQECYAKVMCKATNPLDAKAVAAQWAKELRDRLMQNFPYDADAAGAALLNLLNVYSAALKVDSEDAEAFASVYLKPLEHGAAAVTDSDLELDEFWKRCNVKMTQWETMLRGDDPILDGRAKGAFIALMKTMMPPLTRVIIICQHFCDQFMERAMIPEKFFFNLTEINDASCGWVPWLVYEGNFMKAMAFYDRDVARSRDLATISPI